MRWLALSFILLSAQGSVWALSIETILQNIESKEKILKSLQFEFEQNIKFLETEMTSHIKGEAALAKKGRVRITKKHPEKQITVSDGRTLWIYTPAHQQVWKGSRKDLSKRGLFPKGLLPMDDLSKHLRKEYDLSLLKDKTSSNPQVEIKATPKDVSMGYDLVFTFSTASWLPLQSIFMSDSAKIVTTFSNLKENPKLAKETFSFRPPENTDVIPF